ncbi:MAG: hypothetical protein HKN50_05680 [Gammaproteobacteria bacterium]|nr:hypothetical protein [Gammaproteobacteria bacterium]
MSAVSQAPNRNRISILAAIAGGLAVLLLIMLLWQYQTTAVAKLVPLSIEFSVSVPETRNLQLDYDYGFGFNADHRQLLRIDGAPEQQIVRASISAWKPIGTLRVSGDTAAITLHSVTIRQADSLVRIIAPEPPQEGTFLVVQELSRLLADGGARSELATVYSAAQQSGQ